MAPADSGLLWWASWGYSVQPSLSSHCSTTSSPQPQPLPGHLLGSLDLLAARDTHTVLGTMQWLSALGAQRGHSFSCLNKQGEGSLQQRGHFPHAAKNPKGLKTWDVPWGPLAGTSEPWGRFSICPPHFLRSERDPWGERSLGRRLCHHLSSHSHPLPATTSCWRLAEAMQINTWEKAMAKLI